MGKAVLFGAFVGAIVTAATALYGADWATAGIAGASATIASAVIDALTARC